MFSGCSDITEIDLSNFNTSKFTDISFMFHSCSLLSSLNISNLDTSNVVNMGWMFYKCSSLTSLDLSNFITSKVTSMSGMFFECILLSSLNLSLFDTSNVLNMDWMFYSCLSLSSLNISNFITSNVIDMDGLFSTCSSLNTINISNFDTSKVISMAWMFSDNPALSSLDLSNFITSNVTSMRGMFDACPSLTSLNLSNFDTSNVVDINFIFRGCSKLSFINLSSFTENDLISYSNIFERVPDNVVICLNNENNNSNKILRQLNLYINCYTIYCSNDWQIKQKKLVNETGICKNNFNNDILYKYEFKGKYYEYCINGNLMNNSTINSCSCNIEKCLICPNEPLKENLCLKCNIDHYPIENDNYTNIEGYIKCYKEPFEYYLDKNESIYKKCYETCEICEIKGDNITHNCIKCKENYPYNITKNNYSNCYQNFIYNDNINYTNYTNYNHSLNLSFLTEFPELISEKNEYLDESTKEIISKKKKFFDIKSMIEDILRQKNDTKQMSKEEEIDFYNIILMRTETNFTSEEYDTFYLDNDKEDIFAIGKMQLTLTTINIQRYKINEIKSNTTSIDFLECEILLTKFYNLTINQTIYMKKLDLLQEGMKTPRIEYNLYGKLNGINLEKLNLSICKDSRILLYIPLESKENLDILNCSSGYYNDLCYSATTEFGTDITLKDRRNEFIKKAPCQNDCDFYGYDNIIRKAKCLCIIKEFSSFIFDLNINKTKLLENFKNIKNYANLNLLKCNNKLFSKEGISKNIGFYFIVIIIAFQIMCVIIFYREQFEILKDKIDSIIYAISNLELIKEDKKATKEENKMSINNENNKKGNKIIKKRSKYRSRTKSTELNHKKTLKSTFNNFINESNIINNNNLMNNRKKKKNNNRIDTNINKKEIKKSPNKKIIEKINEIMRYTDDELNKLNYDLAIQDDKRSYFAYYFSLLKTKHSLISCFFNSVDYNCKIIKLDLFVLGFIIDYVMNTLFYNDNRIHNIYIKQGSFDLEYKLPKIIYSSLIAIALIKLLKFLALSNDGIIGFKKKKKKKDVNIRGKNLKDKLRIKFAIFFIMCFIFLIFFWYYLSMFCAIYNNTQFHLIEETLISFTISQIYPFGIYLFPGFFRISALANIQKNRAYLYKISQLLQII